MSDDLTNFYGMPDIRNGSWSTIGSTQTELLKKESVKKYNSTTSFDQFNKSIKPENANKFIQNVSAQFEKRKLSKPLTNFMTINELKARERKILDDIYPELQKPKRSFFVRLRRLLLGKFA